MNWRREVFSFAGAVNADETAVSELIDLGRMTVIPGSIQKKHEKLIVSGKEIRGKALLP